MSTDQRPPMPMICSPDAEGSYRPGTRPASCARCLAGILVNAQAYENLTSSGIDVLLLCMGCFSLDDQRVILGYRDHFKRA